MDVSGRGQNKIDGSGRGQSSLDRSNQGTQKTLDGSDRFVQVIS